MSGLVSIPAREVAKWAFGESVALGGIATKGSLEDYHPTSPTDILVHAALPDVIEKALKGRSERSTGFYTEAWKQLGNPPKLPLSAGQTPSPQKKGPSGWWIGAVMALTGAGAWVTDEWSPRVMTLPETPNIPGYERVSRALRNLRFIRFGREGAGYEAPEPLAEVQRACTAQSDWTADVVPLHNQGWLTRGYVAERLFPGALRVLIGRLSGMGKNITGLTCPNGEPIRPTAQGCANIAKFAAALEFAQMTAEGNGVAKGSAEYARRLSWLFTYHYFGREMATTNLDWDAVIQQELVNQLCGQ